MKRPPNGSRRSSGDSAADGRFPRHRAASGTAEWQRQSEVLEISGFGRARRPANLATASLGLLPDTVRADYESSGSGERIDSIEIEFLASFDAEITGSGATKTLAVVDASRKLGQLNDGTSVDTKVVYGPKSVLTVEVLEWTPAIPSAPSEDGGSTPKITIYTAETPTGFDCWIVVRSEPTLYLGVQCLGSGTTTSVLAIRVKLGPMPYAGSIAGIKSAIVATPNLSSLQSGNEDRILLGRFSENKFDFNTVTASLQPG